MGHHSHTTPPLHAKHIMSLPATRPHPPHHHCSSPPNETGGTNPYGDYFTYVFPCDVLPNDAYDLIVAPQINVSPRNKVASGTSTPSLLHTHTRARAHAHANMHTITPPPPPTPPHTTHTNHALPPPGHALQTQPHQLPRAHLDGLPIGPGRRDCGAHVLATAQLLLQHG